MSKADELYERYYGESGGSDKDLANKGWMKLGLTYAGIPGMVKTFTDDQINWISKNLNLLNPAQIKYINTQLKYECHRKYGCWDGAIQF